ncbi:MAG: 3-deoxy-manno-octulosonate cytidylyltransferase [Verrucomicrobia bacterium]|nr:3-deoxy-manno-octulosonate cytidylyltransferase [Verrucomicrobiota bacterium]
MRILGIIPSRWGSTRFPGKSLALIAGQPLVQRVVERVRAARRLDEVLVATDDERIGAVVRRLGVEAVMTDPALPSGTDRVAAAARGRGADIVINIQGDEPLADPSVIDRLAEVMESDPSWDMATPACAMENGPEVDQPSIVKVVCAADGAALYFSRSRIPHIRDAGGERAASGPVYWQHIGIYAYRQAALDRLVAEPPCLLEQMEKLEQLRALHLGYRIKVVPAARPGLGVDTPEDVAKAEARLKDEGRKESPKSKVPSPRSKLNTETSYPDT